MSFKLSPAQDSGYIEETAARLKKLYTAAVYDILDELGHPHQCLDLNIKPLDRTMRIAGPAFTIAGNADPVEDDEYEYQEGADFAYFDSMYKGCVVVIAATGENRAGHWGEIMSTAAQAKGSEGAIIDGGTRDGNLIFEMENWSVFARYISPVEGRRRYRVREYQRPVAMSGALTSQVRVNPGDWIFGDVDGVICIPKDQVENILRLAEERRDTETKAREEIRAGARVKDIFEKYGTI